MTSGIRRRLTEISRAAATGSEIHRVPTCSHGRVRVRSDYTVFTKKKDHPGIASLNVVTPAKTKRGQYHSIYDDFFTIRILGTRFAYGVCWPRLPEPYYASSRCECCIPVHRRR